MTAVYTYSEARRQLASLLDKVVLEGEVRIKRRDGTVFVISVEPRAGSPLDVGGVSLDITKDEIVEFVHQGRRYAEDAGAR